MWVYDYRTNVHHTLKQNPLKASDLAEFVACYNPENRFKRKELRGDSPSFEAVTTQRGQSLF